MVQGSCFCGDFAYEITGQPAAVVACHCLPCRKTSGTTGSINLIVPNDQFKVTKGIPKLFVRKGDSGKNLTYHNCPICSVLLWAEGEALPGVKIVKIGSVDDLEWVEKLGAPKQEIYCKNMWGWEKGWEGAERKEVS
ncbi:putative glutathione-dependent formaldehyde-activating enzyme-2 [Elsinoe australis]|uniref:Putative glutathione-dependent formaldehyde-activating enzyme-2 n=1 Tax=Elsinoe australis TaxID=40998 RepID=A0A4U7B7I4_9PEZI|nr:putative glutathione-dependent formaldehyde-activating enzyme-2 [Elsinoe australis]